MEKYIAKNNDGEIVAKFQQHTEPNVPDDVSLEIVDDLTKHDMDKIADWLAL